MPTSGASPRARSARMPSWNSPLAMCSAYAWNCLFRHAPLTVSGDGRRPPPSAGR